MRKKIVAGNWKMNKTLHEGVELASEIVEAAPEEVDNEVKLILCTPFIHLTELAKLVKGSTVSLGAQNCHQESSGAFTGEVSVDMIRSAGAEYVIIGHSERREYFEEDDSVLAKKLDKVLEAGLTPLFCCGETLAQRDGGHANSVVQRQLENGVFHLDKQNFAKIVIAYEPVWAIGTGVTATPGQAQEMHAIIRNMIAEKYGNEISQNLSILYGGSCKPSNAAELFKNEDVDGGLIGGASLKASDFIDIAKSF